MTAHKAQGQSLKNVIVDLQSCTGTEAPYVMISRVTSLDGILVLRPFDFKKIRCRQSEYSRKESARINILQLKTKMKHGTLTENADAQQSLYRLGYGVQENGEEDDNTVTLTESHDDNVTLIQRIQGTYQRGQHHQGKQSST